MKTSRWYETLLVLAALILAAAGLFLPQNASLPAPATRGLTNFDALSVSGEVMAAQITARAGTSITVTNGIPFTPLSTYQPITAASAVTPTIAIPEAGKIICLINTSSNAITLDDTGNQVLGAKRALGQYDALCGLSDGTRFIELNFANN